MDKWDLRFVELTEFVSNWSKDKSTKVGAVIVNPKGNNPISIGYNGFPSKCNDDIEERHFRPTKYKWTVHAEANAIANAAKNGQTSYGCTMYVNFFPCSQCAGLIINSGIFKIVCEKKPNLNDPKWGEDWKISYKMFEESNIKIEFIYD